MNLCFISCCNFHLIALDYRATAAASNQISVAGETASASMRVLDSLCISRPLIIYVVIIFSSDGFAQQKIHH